MALSQPSSNPDPLTKNLLESIRFWFLHWIPGLTGHSMVKQFGRYHAKTSHSISVMHVGRTRRGNGFSYMGGNIELRCSSTMAEWPLGLGGNSLAYSLALQGTATEMDPSILPLMDYKCRTCLGFCMPC